MKPAKFKYHRAQTAGHAVELLAADPTGKILAGGQSLIPALSARTLSPSSLIDIMRCPGLDQISLAPTRITIGAACTQSKIEWDAGIRGSVPLLSDALAWVAMPQVRSRGTVVGCLTQGNAGAEVPVVFLALDGEAEILLPGDLRTRLAAKDIYAVEMGTTLPPRSLIVAASFSRIAPGEGWGFSEVQLRQGHFALVCCAATLRLDENGRIRSSRVAIGGLNSAPYRAARAEQALTGELPADAVLDAAAHIASDERPFPARSDLHATGAYRSKAAVAAVTRALAAARTRCSNAQGSAP